MPRIRRPRIIFRLPRRRTPQIRRPRRLILMRCIRRPRTIFRLRRRRIR